VSDSSKTTEAYFKAPTKAARDTPRASEAISRMPMKQLRDTGIGADVTARGPLKPLRDSSRSQDATSMSPVKVHRDTGIGVDRTSSSPVKRIIEAPRALEVLSRTSKFTRDYVDSSRALEAVRRAPTKEHRDITKTLEVMLRSSGFMRTMLDTSRTLDSLTRAVSYVRAPTDSARADELISRAQVKSVGDLTRALEVLTKTSRITVITVDLGVTVDAVRKTVGKMIEADVEPIGFISTVRLKILLDAIRTLERPLRTPSKLLIDSSKLGEYTVRSISRRALDTVRPSEIIKKSALRVLRDTPRGSEYLAKMIVDIEIDSALAVDIHSKSATILRLDSMSALDMAKKELLKAPRDASRALEVFTRTVSVSVDLIDLSAASEVVIKTIAKRIGDLGVPTDVLLSRSDFIRSMYDDTRSLDHISKTIVRSVTPPDSLRALEAVGRRLLKAPEDIIKGLDVFLKVSRSTLTLEDTGVGVDKISKLVSIEREFDVSPVGVIALTKGIAFIETARVSDIASKDVSRLHAELMRTTDVMIRAYSKALRDLAVGEFSTPEKKVTIVKCEIPRVSEIVAKEILRMHLDAIRSLETAFRDLGKLVSERISAREEFFKPVEKLLRDPAKLREIAAKTQFTLAGETVRRVVSLTGDLKKWSDIIESSDYNSKAEAARKLVDLIKRLKLKLE
jgi:hypothetical protein